MLNRTNLLLSLSIAAAASLAVPHASACQAHGTPPAQTAEAAPAAAPAAAPEADAAAGWDEILRAFVTSDGGFRYQALAADAGAMAKLKAFTDKVATTDARSFSREEALAFYINAYNATTIAEVLRLWPVTSVLKQDGFFDKTKHLIAGESLTLNDLETKKIREPFKEPRIHFLVNCASASCPYLVGEAITAANLEVLLDRQATEYVTRTTNFPKGKKSFEISSIFDWYKDDFGGADGVRAFIAAHVTAERRDFVSDKANKVGFFTYDWATNARN